MRITKLIFLICAVALVLFFAKAFDKTIQNSNSRLMELSESNKQNSLISVSRTEADMDAKFPDRRVHRYSAILKECSVSWDVIVHIDLGFKNYHLNLTNMTETCFAMDNSALLEIHNKVITKILRDWNQKRFFQWNTADLRFIVADTALKDLLGAIKSGEDASTVINKGLKESKIFSTILENKFNLVDIKSFELKEMSLLSVEVSLEAL